MPLVVCVFGSLCDSIFKNGGKGTNIFAYKQIKSAFLLKFLRITILLGRDLLTFGLLSLCADGVFEEIFIGKANAIFQFGAIGPTKSSSLADIQ